MIKESQTFKCQRCKIEIKAEPNSATIRDNTLYFVELMEKVKPKDEPRKEILLCGDCKREFSDFLEKFMAMEAFEVDNKERIKGLIHKARMGRLVGEKALNDLIDDFREIKKK